MKSIHRRRCVFLCKMLLVSVCGLMCPCLALGRSNKIATMVSTLFFMFLPQILNFHVTKIGEILEKGG